MGKKIFSIVMGAIATCLCVTTLVVSYKSEELGTIYLKTSGNPEEVLSTFYQAIEQGELQSAYECLAEYSDLGLDAVDDLEENKLITNALKESYRGTVIGDVVQEGLTAKGNVHFQYLDITMLKASVEEGISPVLEYYVDTLSRSEIYDKDGEYLPSFLEMVYDEVLFDVLNSNHEIFKDKDYEVNLTYTDDGWKILVNQDMMNCFLGGKHI